MGTRYTATASSMRQLIREKFNLDLAPQQLNALVLRKVLPATVRAQTDKTGVCRYCPGLVMTALEKPGTLESAKEVVATPVNSTANGVRKAARSVVATKAAVKPIVSDQARLFDFLGSAPGASSTAARAAKLARIDSLISELRDSLYALVSDE